MKNLMTLTLLAVLVGCASNPNKAKKLETEMEKSETITGDTKVGVKDDQMVVQRKTNLAEELRSLQYDVHNLEDRTYGGNRYYGNPGVWGQLDKCRKELASVDNGGSGKMTTIEPLEYVVPEEEISQFGLDEKGTLVSVTEEGLKERITRYVKYKKTLQERNRRLTDQYDMCQLDLQAQRKKTKAESAHN